MNLIFIIIFIISLLLLILGIICGISEKKNTSFQESFYTLSSEKLATKLRIVDIADLHQRAFGKDNADLITAIAALKPDLIILDGDLINRKKTDFAFLSSLCGKLTKIAPVYAGLGNHENAVIYGSDLNRLFLESQEAKLTGNRWDLSPLVLDERILKSMEEAGVVVLQNECCLIEAGGSRINIAGTSCNASSYEKYTKYFIKECFEKEDPSVFRLLICHRPEVVTMYMADEPIDLILSGHVHGGIVVLPYIGAVFGANGEFFPKYTGGLYEIGRTKLLLSRGFEGKQLVPRINNKPELVVLDIGPAETQSTK